MKKIKEVLTNRENNYIFPFLWLHHESMEEVTANIQAMYDAGIRAFCVESRPHPDFAGPLWWQDMDMILHEAEKREMKVWVLDDSHFPTGYANGRIKNEFPQFKKLYLNIKQLDFCGPMKNATVLLKFINPNARASINSGKINSNDHILKVLAAKKNGDHSIDLDTMTDITDNLHSKMLTWDFPAGEWRIFVLVETYSGGEKATEDYLNPLMTEATNVLIQEVYESHYEHYKAKFGNTIAGFFSDEPRLGNQHGAESRIGQNEMVLPWRPGMLDEFFLEDYMQLPLLSDVTANGQEKKIQMKYMNIISQLYSRNFTQVLANWCHNHDVDYIGHVIEDNGAHTRLGYGAGHYFRALAGQDMAGIDVVLNQIMPGMDRYNFKSMTASGWNGEFFHYGLGKLGSSLGHLDEKKHGRTMAEVFGAYGWSEGLSLMKYLVDYMLVRGVNYFVPHAFDPHTFPDPDCPPHLYANGHEPEARLYNKLFNYMNRMSHLFTGGHYQVHTAVLYHAESEWLDGETMPFEKPMRMLMQNQIECEVTPLDYLEQATVREGEFQINDEIFHTLIVPEAITIPTSLINILEKFSKANIKILFINNVSQQNEKLQSCKELLLQLGQIVTLAELPLCLPISDRKFLSNNLEPYLRSYVYQNEDCEILLLVNEDPSQVINVDAQLHVEGPLSLYDGMQNKIYKWQEPAKKHHIKLSLAPGESTVILGAQFKNALQPEIRSCYENKATFKTWQVDFATAEEFPNFSDQQVLDKLQNINQLPGKSIFSGNIRYITNFKLSLIPKIAALDLGDVNEVVEVYLNGEKIGARICKPYYFANIATYLRKGKNILEIIVINNLGIRQQDYLSQFMLIKPAGLLGPVAFMYTNEGGSKHDEVS